MKTQGQLEVVAIIDCGGGWYDFKNIPHLFHKNTKVYCGSDDLALREAVKLNPSWSIDYHIVKK